MVNIGEITTNNFTATPYMFGLYYIGVTSSQLQASSQLTKGFTVAPAQLTSDQNNYNPTNLNLANILELNGDASFRALTGLTAQPNGTIIDLVNTGSNTILLYDEGTTQAASSTATNRFAFNGYDIPIFPRSAVTLMYSASLSRWIRMHETSHVIPHPYWGYYVNNDMSNNIAGDQFDLAAASGGSVTVADGGFNHPGCLNFNLGTSTSGTGTYRVTGATITLGNSWYYRFDALVKVLQLSNGTDNYTLRVGFIDSATAESTDGAFFRYNHAVNSGKWERVTINNTTATATDTTVTVGTTNFTRLTIIVNPAGTNVEFFIDGTSVGSNVANIPTGSTRNTGAGMMFVKTAGTTNTSFLLFDAIETVGYAPTKRLL